MLRWSGGDLGYCGVVLGCRRVVVRCKALFGVVVEWYWFVKLWLCGVWGGVVFNRVAFGCKRVGWCVARGGVVCSCLMWCWGGLVEFWSVVKLYWGVDV